MLTTFLGILWLFLPAGVANMTPPLLKWLPIPPAPIWKKKLGPSKTWRGLIGGTITATLLVYLQQYLNFEFSVIDYETINPIILGPILGGGALIGDAVESYFKRRKGITNGHPWIPFDQIDWILAAVIGLNLYISIDWQYSLTAFVFYSLLHPLINFTGYLLKIREVPL